MAARKQNLERKLFYGIHHKYHVQFMIDTETGKIHAGILGKHIIEDTVAVATAQVQHAIDTHEQIEYTDYLVFDLSREPADIKPVAIKIGRDTGFPDDGRLALNREYLVVREITRPAQWERIPASHLVVAAGTTLAKHVGNNVKALANAYKRMDDHQTELESLRRNAHPVR